MPELDGPWAAVRDPSHGREARWCRCGTSAAAAGSSSRAFAEQRGQPRPCQREAAGGARPRPRSAKSPCAASSARSKSAHGTKRTRRSRGTPARWRALPFPPPGASGKPMRSASLSAAVEVEAVATHEQAPMRTRRGCRPSSSTACCPTKTRVAQAFRATAANASLIAVSVDGRSATTLQRHLVLRIAQIGEGVRVVPQQLRCAADTRRPTFTPAAGRPRHR